MEPIHAELLRPATELEAVRKYRPSATRYETFFLERANKFNPRCTEARLLGFCLKSSRYIVVDFDGRFRMVRTIKRANADDRWKVMSPRGLLSANDLESTPAEFTCSRGTRGEDKPAAQRLERHPVDALPPGPNHDPVPRRLNTQTEECRIRVEGEIRKTEEEKARLRAAASRVGDAPTGRALKRVRFAESRVDDNAEMPEQNQSQHRQTSLLKPRHPVLRPHPRPRQHYPRLQSECLIKR